MSNNFARLKDEADIGEVVDYLGLHVTPKGSARFILCPNPAHDDTHPDNCYFKAGWNNVYCTVCHKAIQAIDLISYVTGASYGTAADTLWEIEGRPDWYYDRSYGKKKQEFSLSGKDAEFLGIHIPRRIKVPVSIKDTKVKLQSGMVYDNSYIDGYLIDKSEPVSWKDFMTEEEMKKLVLKKIEEKTKSLENQEKLISFIYHNGKNLPDHELVKKQFEEDRKHIDEIRRSVNGQLKDIA